MNLRRLFVALFCLPLCLACSGNAAAPEDALSESGTAPTESGDTGGTASGNECFLSARAVDFDFSGARAVIVTDTPAPATLEESDLETNTWILGDDGTFTPGAVFNSNCPGGDDTLSVTRVDASPTGEIYLWLEHAVLINDDRCRWVVVDTDNAAACAGESDTDFEFFQVSFTPNGDVYYSDRSATVKRRDRETGATETVFEASSLDYAFDGFQPMADGSLLLQGIMTGTSRGFFRFVPSQDSNATDLLQEPCLADVNISLSGSEPQTELFIASDDTIYARATGDICADADEAKVYRATLVDDDLVFEAIPGTDADFFAQDSLGTVYAITGEDDDVTDAATPLDASGTLSPITTSLATTELFRVKYDAIYATGIDEDGKHAFIRKSLIDGVETDLLGDEDVLIQTFDVATNGDVSFAALDETSATRRFFLYDTASSSLRNISELPGEALQIVYIGDVDFGF